MARKTFEVSFYKFLQVCLRFYEFLQFSEYAKSYCLTFPISHQYFVSFLIYKETHKPLSTQIWGKVQKDPLQIFLTFSFKQR